MKDIQNTSLGTAYKGAAFTSSSKVDFKFPSASFTLYLRSILPLIISPLRGFIISSQSALTKSGIHHNTGKHHNCYQKSVVQVKNGTRSYPGIHTSRGFLGIRNVAAAVVSTVDVFAGPSLNSPTHLSYFRFSLQYS